MVAALLGRAADRAGLDLVVESAGTLGIEGSAASPQAIEALQEIGLDLRSHRSRGLSAALVGTADRIVAMEREHLALLARRFPVRAQPRVLLRAFERSVDPDPAPDDLEDPIGRPLEFYRAQRSLIERCVDHLLVHLGGSPDAPGRG